MTTLTTAAQTMINSAFASLGSAVVSDINSLISESNTLMNQLNTFAATSGTSIAIATIPADGDYQNGAIRILTPPAGSAASQADYILENLAHEVGHFMNSIGSIYSMTGANPLFSATSATPANQALLVADAMLSEGIAIYNNYVVAQEILTASGGADQIDQSGPETISQIQSDLAANGNNVSAEVPVLADADATMDVSPSPDYLQIYWSQFAPTSGEGLQDNMSNVTGVIIKINPANGDATGLKLTHSNNTTSVIDFSQSNVTTDKIYNDTTGTYTFEIVNPQNYTGTISQFSAGDTIDLLGIGTATSATLGAGNVLTVSGGSSNVTLDFNSGQSLKDIDFQVSSDGNGGTDITATSLVGLNGGVVSFVNPANGAETSPETLSGVFEYSDEAAENGYLNFLSLPSDSFYSVNLLTGAYTSVTNSADSSLDFLAADNLTGALVGVSSLNEAVTIDPATGAPTNIAAISGLTGLYFGADAAVNGMLYFIGSTSSGAKLYSVNIGTGAVSSVATTATNFTADNLTGKLVGVSGSNVVTINPTTGALTTIATISGLSGADAGTETAGNGYFYFDGPSGSGTKIYSVNLTTDQVTSVATSSTVNFIADDSVDLTVAQLLADTAGVSKGVSGFTVDDTAANVAGSLASLQTLASAGGISSIVLTGGSASTLALTSAQLTGDTAALATITSPYGISVSGGGTATMGSTLSGVQTVALQSASSAYSFTANNLAGLVVTDSSAANDTLIGGNGANQTLNGGTGADTITIGTGTNDVVNSNGTNDVDTMNGADGWINLNGTGDKVTASGSGDTVISNTSGQVVTSTGASQTVTFYGTNSSATISGNSTWSFMNGNSNTVTVASSASDTNITASGAGEQITQNGSSDYFRTNSGSNGDTITANGVGDWGVAGGNTDGITVASASTGDNMTATGTTDTITVNSASTQANADGTTDKIYANGNNDYVTTGGTQATVTATASTDWVSIGGTGDTITASSTSTNDNFTVSGGSGAIINIIGTDNYAHTTDSGNTVNITGTDATVDLDGTGDAATLSSTGGTVNVGGASSGVTVNASAGTNDAVSLNANLDTATISSSSVWTNVNSTNDTVTVTGANDTVDVTGTGDKVYLNGSGAWLFGTGTGDTININGTTNAITAADDTVNIGAGISASIGGGGSELYNFASTFGTDLINNLGNGSATTPNGTITFASGVTDEKLWFQESGSNLLIDLLGTTDQITVDNWYGSNAGAQVSEIEAGGLKLDSQVASLVSAMATYAANNSGFNPATATSMPTNTTLQNAIAAAWHS